VFIANRGTETKGEGKWQGIATDAGMVITGVNAQMPDARMFAERVKATVEKQADHNSPLAPSPAIPSAGPSPKSSPTKCIGMA
jgi:hypothetical protein